MGNFPSKISPEEAVKKDQIVKTKVLFKTYSLLPPFVTIIFFQKFMIMCLLV
jgi:hypothetical protein